MNLNIGGYNHKMKVLLDRCIKHMTHFSQTLENAQIEKRENGSGGGTQVREALTDNPCRPYGCVNACSYGGNPRACSRRRRLVVPRRVNVSGITLSGSETGRVLALDDGLRERRCEGWVCMGGSWEVLCSTLSLLFRRTLFERGLPVVSHPRSC